MTTVMPGMQTSPMAVTSEPARAWAVAGTRRRADRDRRRRAGGDRRLGDRLGRRVVGRRGDRRVGRGCGPASRCGDRRGRWPAQSDWWPCSRAPRSALTDRAADSAGAGDGRAFALAATLAAVFHLAVGLPDGRLTRRRLVLVAGGYLAAVGAGFVLAADAPAVPAAPLVVLGLVMAAVAASVIVRSCRRATARDRARLQWAGWAALVTGGRRAGGVGAFAIDRLARARARRRRGHVGERSPGAGGHDGRARPRARRPGPRPHDHRHRHAGPRHRGVRAGRRRVPRAAGG